MEKIKNLPVMRFVAFAVALAIILGLSSVMLSFTASAENVSFDRVTLEDGTQVPTINGFSIIGSKAVTNIMVSYIRKTYGDGLIFLIAQDKTTKDIYYSRYPQAYLHDKEYLYCYFPSGYDCIAPFATSDSSVYDYFYIDDTYTAHHEGFGKFYKPSFYNASVEAVSPDLANLNYYWCYTNSIPRNQKEAISLSTIIGKSDNTGFVPAVSPEKAPKAEFVTCASYDSEDGSLPLWFKDFTAEGQQYPLFTYYIHDNGNKHSYSLKLSYSSSAKEDVKKVFNLRENTPADADAEKKDMIERIIALYALHGVKMHDLTPYVRTALNLKFPTNLTYNQAFVLSSPEMDFTVVGNNKVYTICLSDYSDILQCLIYKAEIIDNNTGTVLDTTYFTSKQTYNKGNSGFGSKIYDYNDNYDDMIDDIKNNTPSVQPVKKDSFISDGDVINTTKYDYYSGLKIDDIFGSLQSSASSLGSFFQACMSIIPAGILAVIIGGLSIVIILRILGR